MSTKTEQIFMKRLSHRLSQLKIDKIKEKKPTEAGYTSHYLKTDEGESPPRVRIPVPPPPPFAAGTATQNALIFCVVSEI